MADNEQFRVTWVDGKREPTVEPNPDYPSGIDVVASTEGAKACRVELEYPAARIGYYRIECRVCGQRIMATTAGRPDDPRSVTFNCYVPPPKPVVIPPTKKPTKAH